MQGQSSMQEGFDMLESLKFSDAEKYFVGYFDTHEKTARICHGRAVGLGGDAIRALKLFAILEADYPEDVEVLLNLGEAYLWNEMPDEAVAIYNKILIAQPSNFVANLGVANAYASQSENDLALTYLEKALEIEPENSSARLSQKFVMIAKAYNLYKDGRHRKSLIWLDRVIQIDPLNKSANEMMAQINEKSKTTVSTKYGRSADQGNNKTATKDLHVDFRIADRHKVSFDVGIHDSQFGVLKSAKQQSIFISDEITLNKTFSLDLGAGISASRSQEIIVDRSLFKASLEMFLSAKLYSKIQCLTEVHNYTVDLIESDILMRNYSIATNYAITPRWGIYGNAVYSTQSDGNERKLFYGSTYYSLVRVPIVRVGLSYNYLGFKEQEGSYFSPERYQLAECFMKIDNSEGNEAFKYKFHVSFGNQKIENEKLQAVSRAEASVGYNFKNGILFRAEYLASSSAAATAIGEYSYHQWTVFAAYRF